MFRGCFDGGYFVDPLACVASPSTITSCGLTPRPCHIGEHLVSFVSGWEDHQTAGMYFTVAVV